MPEGFQNDVEMCAEIIDFSCFYEKDGNAPKYLFYNRKRGSGHLKIEEKLSTINGKSRSEKDMPKGAKTSQKGANIESKIHQKLPKRAKGGQRASQKAKLVGKITCQKSRHNFDAEKNDGDRCRAPGTEAAVRGGPSYNV